jgi:Protein kinase domain
MDPESRLGSGRFVVKRLLGEGAQGATYEATDAETGKVVAIKRFDVRGARSWKDVELAERETRVLASLDHPLVPRYIEHFEEEGALYLVMERVTGESLEAIRKREGPLSEVEVRRFLASADRALTYLHGRGSPVVHRDVKPSNVIRRPDGSYVFVDFGAVSEFLFRRGSSTIVGTMGYMAPEQMQGRALSASDVYAVGATAVAALTGVEPETLPHKGLRLDVRAALKGRVSEELVVSLERMLEPDPDLRAPSIAAALDVPSADPASVARAPLRAAPSNALVDRTSEDAAVKSVRRLLWVLWGLGWVLVPMVFGQVLGMAEAIPIVMFGWLAANLILTWHKGAALRAVLRAWNAEEARAPGTLAPGTRAPVLHQRVEVDAVQHQVRVHTSDLRPEEIAAGTEVETREERRRRAL